MPRRKPPEGYITATEALSIVGSTLYKYVKKGVVKRYGPDTLKHKYYKRSEVEAVAQTETIFYEEGILIDEKNNTIFAQATARDMDGVYEVAASLFPHGTTSADARRPLVEKCPTGNYIVKERGEIVAFIHLQPLRHDRMMDFMNGKIRGRDITTNDLETIVPGNPVDFLVKSMGATRKYGIKKSVYYIQRLLLGTGHELAKLGSQGIIIRHIYATSETETGIALSMHARMKVLKRLKAPDPEKGEPARYAFVLDVASSDIPLLQEYKQAISQWQQERLSSGINTTAIITQEISKPTRRAQSQITPSNDIMNTRDFAALHNLNINQVHSVIGETEQIDQAGMRAVYLEWGSKTRFRKCDFCPHQ